MVEPSGAPLEHQILDDSSFAAITTADGTRLVFFQDSTYQLREASYPASTCSWLTSVSSIIPNTADARPKTPLSASIHNTTKDNSFQLTVLCITTDDCLVSTSSTNGTWSNTTAFYNVSQFIASSTSRSLSLTPIPSNDGSDELMLLFENLTGNVTCLRGSYNFLSSLQLLGGAGKTSQMAYSLGRWPRISL